MAQTQRERAERPDEALQVAERVLRGLAVPIPQAGATPMQLRLQEAEASIGAAVSAARQVGTAIRLRPQRDQAIRQLEQLRERLVQLGAHSVGDAELDRRHQAVIQPLLQSIDGVLRTMRAGRGALSREDAEAASIASDAVSDRTGTLSTVIAGQRTILQANGPPELVRIIDNALELAARGETDRANILARELPAEVARRSAFIMSDAGTADRQAFIRFGRRLADLSVDRARFSVADARTELAQIGTQSDQHRLEFLETARRALEAQVVSLQQLLLRQSSEAIREQIRAIIESANQLVRRLGAPDQAAAVTDEDLHRISRRMLGAKEMSDDLESAPAALRPQLGTIYAAGLGILANGGSYQNFDAVMFAASEIKRSARSGSTAAARAYRTDIGARVRDISTASDQAGRDTAQQALLSRVATGLSSELSAEAALLGRLSPEAAAPFTQLAGTLGERPGEATLEALTRTRMMLEYGRRARDAVSPAHQLSRESKSAVLGIYTRALTTLASGGSLEAVATQASLAEMYARTGQSAEHRSDIERMSAGLAQDPGRLAQAQQYVAIDAAILELTRQRDARGGPAAGSPARQAMDMAITELEGTFARLGRGERMATREQADQYVPQIRARMQSDAELRRQVSDVASSLRRQDPSISADAAEAQAVNMTAAQIADDAEDRRLQELVSASTTFIRLIGGTRIGSRKAELGELFRGAVTSIIERSADDAMVFRQAAEAYSSLPQDMSFERDRQEIMAICRQAAMGERQEGRRRFDPTQLRLLQVYQQRARFESAITDPTLLRNTRAYFDLALRAARSGDQNAYQTVLDLAVLHGGMSAVPVRGLTEDQARQRTEAIEFVRTRLGNFSAQRGRAMDIGAEGSRGWRLPEGAQMPPITTSLLSGTSVYEALGGGDAEQGIAELNRINGACATHSLNLDSISFERRASGIVAAGETRAAQSRYAAQAERMRAEARRATERGDTALAEYFTRQAAICDRRFVTESADAARQMHASGRSDIEEGMRLADEGRGTVQVTEARARERISQLIEILPPDGRRAVTEMLSLADMNPQQMLRLAPQIVAQLPEQMRQGFIDRLRAARSNEEQLRGVFLELMLSQLSAQMPEGVREPFVARITEARGNTASMRRLFVEILYTQALSTVSQYRMERGRDLQQRAGQVLDGLEAFDRSVRTVDTPRSESGRLELFAGIRSIIGAATNRDVNMLGEYVNAQGQAVRTADEAAPLQESRRPMLQAQGRASLALGRRLVEAEETFMRTRNSIVGNAQTQVRDENVAQAATLIQRMIGGLMNQQGQPDTERQARFNARLAAARARRSHMEGERRVFDETEQQFRTRQVTELQALITELCEATGTSATRRVGDSDVPVFDVSRGYGDYRRIVGLAYGGHFNEANRQIGDSNSRILSSSLRLGGRINQRELQSAWDAVRDAPNPPALQVALERLRSLAASANAQGLPLGDAGGVQVDVAPNRALMESLTDHLSEERARDFMRRFDAIPAGSEGDIRRMRLLTELANESVPDPMRSSLPPGERRSVPLMQVAGTRSMGYYNQDVFDARLDDADRMLEQGNGREARAALGLISRDMTASYFVQGRDTNRFRDRMAAARRAVERQGVPTEFIEDAPQATADRPGEGPRERASREDRNLAITSRSVYNPETREWESIVDVFQGSYQRSVDDLNASARANASARREILANAGNPDIANPAVDVNPALVRSVIAQLPQDQRQAYLDRLGDPSTERQEAARIYGELAQRSPDALRAVAALPENSQYRAQITADADVSAARIRDQERSRAWTFARINIREGLNQLRMGDMAQTSRDVRSDRVRASQSAWDEYKGRPGDMYRTPQAHREYGARRFELAATMLDEHNDHQFTDVLMSNQPVTARIYQFEASAIRSWHTAPNGARTMVGTDHGWVSGNRLQVTVWNNTTDDGARVSMLNNFGDRLARRIRPVDELSALNFVEMREFASYADDDTFYDSRALVRPSFISMADSVTDLQLAQIGIRRDRYEGPESDTYGFRLVRWTPTNPEDYRRVGDAYSEFLAMRGDMQNRLFAFTAPWGDDEHRAYVGRVATRMGSLQEAVLIVQGSDRALAGRTFDSAMRDSSPYVVRVIDTDGTMRMRREGEEIRDRDRLTIQYAGEMVSMQGWYNVAVAAGEFVVATVGVVAAPVTGGASLVLTVGVGAVGVHRGVVMAEQYGEWTNEAYFTAGMGALTIVLAPAGFIAGGGRFLVSGAQLGLEAEMAAQGLTSLARAAPTVGRFGRAVQFLEGTSGLSAEAAMAQTGIRQLATRFFLGAPELGGFARGVHLTGTAMTFAGATQFAWQMPRMWRAVERGEMAWQEAAFGGFQAFMQPYIQARAAQRMAARSIDSGGIPEYVPRWRQLVGGLWSGNPMLDAQTHALSLYSHQIGQTRAAMPRPALASYDAHAQSQGARIRPETEARILAQFNSEVRSGRVTTFDQFLARSPEARLAYLEAARDANFWTANSRPMTDPLGQPMLDRNGQPRLAALSDENGTATYEYNGPRLHDRDLSGQQLDYVRARRGGMNEQDALAVADRHATETRVPAVRAAEQMYTQVRRGEIPVERLSPQMQAYIRSREQGSGPALSYEAYRAAGGPGARASMRARADRVGAEAQAREQRIAIGREFASQYSRMDGEDYVLGTGGRAVTVTPDHHQLAGDLVYQAEGILRRPSGETLPQALENARARMRDQLIRNGAEEADADRIVGERMVRIREMIRDPEFRRATLAEGGPDRAAQLRIGLRQSGYLTEIGNRPAVLLAVNRIEAEAITRNQELEPADLDHFAIQRSGWADERRTQAESADSDARVAEISGTPGSAAIHRERAARLRSEADALDDSAEILHNEAAARREVRRAEAMRARADNLDAQAAWHSANSDERAALTAQARALRAEADTVAPPARPRAAPMRRIGEDRRIEVTMELSQSVRSVAGSYRSGATEGTMIGGGEARQIFIVNEREYTPAQVTEASRTASVADLVVRRRAAGYAVSDEQIPRLLQDLGLPETLAPQVRNLANDGEFILALGLGNREAGLRVALGQADAQALSPSRVRESIAQADAQAGADPVELRRVADERRQAAGIWAERARIETGRARQLERSSADPAAITEANQRAGAAERIANEHRESARRLSARADAMEQPPPEMVPTPRAQVPREEEPRPAARRQPPPEAAPTPRVRTEVPPEAVPSAARPTARRETVPPAAARRSRQTAAQETARVELPEEALARAIIARESRQGAHEWLVGGERVRVGGQEQEVSTGRALMTIEDHVVTMARGGEESDIVVVSADKRRLNQLNQMLGRQNGDAALDAYREILGRAATRAGGEGTVFLVRPSATGDEVIVVIRVPRGRGQAAREAFDARMREAATEVFNERSSPGYTGAHPLGHLRSALREPTDLVTASVLVSDPIQVRRQGDGSVTARYPDGRDAMITRPGGRREFLPPAIRAVDDPSFAPGLRQRLGTEVREQDTQPNPGIEPVEAGRISQVWERRGGTLSDTDRQVVDRVTSVMRERGLDPANPEHRQAAFDQVARERTMLSPEAEEGRVRQVWDRRGGTLSPSDRQIIDRVNEVIRAGGLDPADRAQVQGAIRQVAAERTTIRTRSVGFEVRLMVPEDVRVQLEALLAETGKGLAEVFENRFGIRGLNTFLGHYGSNRVINEVEAAVGAYAREQGLTIRRLGTMKYVIEGGSEAQTRELFDFINASLATHGVALSVSRNSPVIEIEPGTSAASALAHVSNGHLVVDRRSDPARRTDWNGHDQQYEDANSLIGAMGIGNDASMRTLLGTSYPDLQPVIELVRSRSDIRNFEDLVTALRRIVGGERGRTYEGAFRRFIVEQGPAFRDRLVSLVPAPQRAEAAELPLAAGAEGRVVVPRSRRGPSRREEAAPTARRGPSYRPGEELIPTERRGRTPPPRVSEPPMELSARDIIEVEPARPPPPPPQSSERQTTRPRAPVAPMDPQSLTPAGLPGFADRLINPATRQDAVTQLGQLPPMIRDQVLTFRDRYAQARGDAAAVQSLSREFGSRILAAHLAGNPDALMTYAAAFRGGVDSQTVNPQAREIFNAMPQEVRAVVLEYAQQMNANWNARAQLSHGYADRLGRALDIATVRDIHAGNLAGLRPSDPADLLALGVLNAGGRAPDLSTPQGQRALEHAAAARRMAMDLAARTGRPDVMSVVREQAENVRVGRRPEGRDDAAAFDFIQSIAQHTALRAGRTATDPSDYMHGALMLALYQRVDRSTVSATVASAYHGEEHSALEQHLVAYLDIGGNEAQVRIYRDGRVNIDDVAPEAVGLQSWPSEHTRRLFLRYIQDRLREPLRTMFADAARRIPARAGLGAAEWAPAIAAAEGRSLDLRAQRPAAGALAARLTPEDVIRGFRTYDIASRQDAVSAFMRMPADQQAQVLAGMERHARGPMQAAADLEANARQIEAQVEPQAAPLRSAREALETESAQFWQQRERLRNLADQAEANGDGPAAARHRAESQRIENEEWGPRQDQIRHIDGELTRLYQPATDLHTRADNLRGQARYWNEQATYLREAQSLGPDGAVGRHLSQSYGVSQDALQRAYLSGITASDGRRAVYDALGIRLGGLPDQSVRSAAYRSFTTLADDPYLAGMIFTGGMLRHVTDSIAPGISLNPGDRIVVRGISFQNGLVGAYRLTVEVVDSAGRPRAFTDASGRQRTSMTVFVKRQDLTPDGIGSEGGRLMGAPSPEVRTHAVDGSELTYVSPEGQRIRYGIMGDIRDFRGEIWVGGQRIRVSVDSAEDLWGLMFGDANPRTAQQRSELMGALRDHPDQFLDALGYAQTSFAAAGFYDRHEGNVWAMWLRITDQPPGSARRAADSLRSQAYPDGRPMYLVRENGDGTFSFLRFGAIDSDTFGSYRAHRRDDGSVSLTGMVGQFTTDLHRVFVHLTRTYNAAEIQRAHAEGRAPRLRTVEQFMEYSFGSNMDGPFMRGMRRWLDENGPATPQGIAMRQALTALMQRYDGQRSGMGFAMEGPELARYERDGYVRLATPLNGRRVAVVDGADGRTTFVADGQSATGATFTAPVSRRIAEAIPDGQTRYLIRVDNIPSQARRDLTRQLTSASGGRAPRTASTSTLRGREYIVIEDYSIIPPAHRDGLIVALREGDRILYTNTGAVAAALPEGRQVFIVPAAGLMARDRALASRRGRTLDVGIEASTERMFFVFDRAEDIPAGARSRAVSVTRHGDDITSSSPDMARLLGIANAQRVGAVPMLDHMLGMGEPQWTNLWQRVRDSILTAEGADRARAAAGGQNAQNAFLGRRVPDPQDHAALPQEYGGPAVPRTQQGARPPPLPQPQLQPSTTQVNASALARETAAIAYGFESAVTRRTRRDGTEVLVYGGRGAGNERELSQTQLDRAAEIATYAQLLQQRRIQPDLVPEDIRTIAQGLATPDFVAAGHTARLGRVLDAMDQARPPSPTRRSSPAMDVSDSMIITERQGSEPPIQVSDSDLLPSPARAPSRRAPDAAAARDDLESQLNVTIATGERTTYAHPAEPSVQYSEAQMRLARDASAAAEQMILPGGRVPRGIPPDVLALARRLAGTPDNPTAFRSAAISGNRSRMMLEALHDQSVAAPSRARPPSARSRPIPVDVAAPAGRVSMDAHFQPGEFARLHPTPTDTPVYHNQEHTQNVAQMTYDLAIARGLPREQALFLSQVAMLHDIDPTRAAGRPSRVAATIEWMRSPEGQALMRRWGWSERQAAVAEAMIQRTEFPFDGTRVGQQGAFGPRRAPALFDADARLGDGARDRIAGYYNDQSPRERYVEMLRRLSPEDRAFVLREAAMLSEYSDKASWYFQPPRAVMQAVRGLGNEAGFDPIPGTRAFLDAVGRPPIGERGGSFDIDRGIARELGVPEPLLQYLPQVLARMSPEQRRNWEMTLEVFGLAEAYHANERLTPQRAGELGVGAPERAFLGRLRARVASGEITAQQVPEEIIRFVEGRGGGGGPGRRPGSGGPSEGYVPPSDSIPTPRMPIGRPEASVDLARRLMSGDAQTAAAAREAYDALPQARKVEVGVEVAYGLRLDTQAGIRDFAQRVVEGRPGAREHLEMLPFPIRRRVEMLTNNPRGPNDPASRFRAPATRDGAVRDAWNHLQDMLPPRGAADQQAAVGGVRGDQPRAMAGDRRRSLIGNVQLIATAVGLHFAIDHAAVPPSGGQLTTPLREIPTSSLHLDNPQHAFEYALRLVNRDESTLAAFRNLSEEAQSVVTQYLVDIGVQIGDRVLHFADPFTSQGDMRAFARALARDEPDALYFRNLLPRYIREQISPLSADPRVRAEAELERGRTEVRVTIDGRERTFFRGDRVVFPGREAGESYELLPTGIWQRIRPGRDGRRQATQIGSLRDAKRNPDLVEMNAIVRESERQLYETALLREFHAQSAFPTLEAYQAHVEQLPQAVQIGISGLVSRRASLSAADLDAFFTSIRSPDRPLTQAQLQLIANRLSQELGIASLDVAGWRAHDLPINQGSRDVISPGTTVRDIARQTVEFATTVREESERFAPGATRVYLWRDAFGAMVADSAMSRGGGRVAGALVSRSTLGSDFFYGQGGSPTRPAEGSLLHMVETAQTRAMASGDDPRTAFFRELRGMISERSASDPRFRATCDAALQHLITQGALQVDSSGRVIPQSVVFVDTGLRTIPAFLQALVEVRYGGNVRAHSIYHTIQPGYEFLSHTAVRGEGEAQIVFDIIGSHASFMSGGSYGADGRMVLTPGNAPNLRDSILFNLLLNNELGSSR